MTSKNYILLFRYDSIELFLEEKGIISRQRFSNGKYKLSNCVGFSYEKEDLIFLPDGDLFDVNSNSPFSDYLDFAGYNFSVENAIETIVTTILKNKLIPNLGKGDDVFLFNHCFYYEDDNRKEERSFYFDNLTSSPIYGHKIHYYDFYPIFKISYNLFLDCFGANLFVGYPYITWLLENGESSINGTITPTVDRNVLDKVLEEHPLPKNIPQKLLRNICNRIITSNLYGLQIPNSAIYQNRVINFTNTSLSSFFEELAKENAKMVVEQTKKVKETTYFFDFGVHSIIKAAYFSVIKKPILIDSKYNDYLTFALLRTMLIYQKAIDDTSFRFFAINYAKQYPDQEIKTKAEEKISFYRLSFIRFYYLKYKKINIYSNKQFDQLMNLSKAIKNK